MVKSLGLRKRLEESIAPNEQTPPPKKQNKTRQIIGTQRSLSVTKESSAPTPHFTHLQAVRGDIWRRYADEVFQEFGLVSLGGGRRSRRSSSGLAGHSISFVPHLLLLDPALLPQVFGLSTRRPAGVGAEACTAENGGEQNFLDVPVRLRLHRGIQQLLL